MRQIFLSLSVCRTTDLIISFPLSIKVNHSVRFYKVLLNNWVFNTDRRIWEVIIIYHDVNKMTFLALRQNFYFKMWSKLSVSTSFWRYFTFMSFCRMILIFDRSLVSVVLVDVGMKQWDSESGTDVQKYNSKNWFSWEFLYWQVSRRRQDFSKFLHAMIFFIFSISRLSPRNKI